MRAVGYPYFVTAFKRIRDFGAKAHAILLKQKHYCRTRKLKAAFFFAPAENIRVVIYYAANNLSLIHI